MVQPLIDVSSSYELGGIFLLSSFVFGAVSCGLQLFVYTNFFSLSQEKIKSVINTRNRTPCHRETSTKIFTMQIFTNSITLPRNQQKETIKSGLEEHRDISILDSERNGSYSYREIEAWKLTTSLVAVGFCLQLVASFYPTIHVDINLHSKIEQIM